MKRKLFYNFFYLIIILLSFTACHSDEQNEFFCLNKTIGEIQKMYSSKLNWQEQETTKNIFYNIQIKHKNILFRFEKPSILCTDIRVKIDYDSEKKYADKYVKSLDREWKKENYTTWYDDYNKNLIVLEVDYNDNTYNFYFTSYK